MPFDEVQTSMEVAEGFESGAAMKAVIDVLTTPVFVKDRKHRWVFVNDAFCRFVGQTKEEILGRTDLNILPPRQAQDFRSNDQLVLLTGEDNASEDVITDASGQVRIVVTNKSLIRVDGDPYIVAVVTDITSYRQAEAHSQYLARHDALSGLPNRTVLQEKIDRIVARPDRKVKRSCLLCLNLDRLKQVNDAYGYPAGDELIREFAARLLALVRSADTVTRLGGDDFAILLKDIRSKEIVPDLCRRILHSAQEPYTIRGVDITIGVSIGVVPRLDTIRSSIEALRRGDVALNSAKRDGGGRYRIYHEEMDAGRRDKLLIESELREALRSGTRLEVYYQPQVSGTAISGVEALVRWNHPRLGFLGPSRFLPEAEESGLIVELGDFVLDAALTAASRWPGLRLAVNLSAVQLNDPQLARRLLASLERHDFEPARLELEITETAMLCADAATNANLRKFRAAGIRIALDDFGTGYSSLSHLQDIDINRIKIDRSFIRNLGSSSDSAPIVRALMHIADMLGLEVIAEGVETEEQRRFLVEVGCTNFQGFLFSPPVPEDQIPRTITSVYTAAE